MRKYFYFGEKIDGYDVRVLNEREVRAAAGILFFFAMITFLNSWLTGNFNPTKIFVIAFLIDFFIRIFINPKYAPSLILGRLAVSGQKVEYVGAPQKRFAWAIGFVLALTMFFMVIINNIIGPLNLFICLSCLILLFFESAFGICIGCKVYNLFYKEKARLCPGGSCEVFKKEPIQKVGFVHVAVVLVFFAIVMSIPSLASIELSGSHSVKKEVVNEQIPKVEAVVDDACKVPEWAISIGHGEMWEMHHGCK